MLSCWLYVVAIIDLFLRKVIGYSMADHLRTELVLDALRMILERGRKLASDLWLHSDRASRKQRATDRKTVRFDWGLSMPPACIVGKIV